MPESVGVQIEEVSEEALRERVKLRKVTAAVTLYDQLLQAGNYRHKAFSISEFAKENRNLKSRQARRSQRKPPRNC